jgi:hypothetical protein
VTTKSTIFWDVVPCGLVEANLYQTKRCHIREDSIAEINGQFLLPYVVVRGRFSLTTSVGSAEFMRRKQKACYQNTRKRNRICVCARVQ